MKEPMKEPLDEPIDKSNIIKINIGGTMFSTTNSTLFGHHLSPGQRQNNFFTSILSGKTASIKDENGAYFVDRDPTYFPVILEYLRTGVVNILDDSLALAVYREADFYRIKLPKRTIFDKESEYHTEVVSVIKVKDEEGVQSKINQKETEGFTCFSAISPSPNQVLLFFRK